MRVMKFITNISVLLISGYYFIINAIALHFGLAVRRPFIVSYTLNSVCNLRCSYCYIKTDPTVFPTDYKECGLALEQAESILSNIRRDTSFLILTGGEPFVYPELLALLKYAKNTLRFLNISVASNGILIGEHKEYLQYIDRLGVSFDLMRERQYSKLIAKMLLDLSDLRRQGVLPSLHFSVTVSPNDKVQDFDKFIDYCKCNGFKIWLQPLRVDNDFSDWDCFIKFVDDFINVAGQDCVLNDLGYIKSVISEHPSALCVPQFRLHVNYDGSLVFPCCKLAVKTDGVEKNIINNRPFTVWNELAGATKFSVGTRCSNCGFSCYFETTGLHKRPIAFIKKATRHLAGW